MTAAMQTLTGNTAAEAIMLVSALVQKICPLTESERCVPQSYQLNYTWLAQLFRNKNCGLVAECRSDCNQRPRISNCILRSSHTRSCHPTPGETWCLPNNLRCLKPRLLATKDSPRVTYSNQAQNRSRSEEYLAQEAVTHGGTCSRQGNFVHRASSNHVSKHAVPK